MHDLRQALGHRIDPVFTAKHRVVFSSTTILILHPQIDRAIKFYLNEGIL
jgi:hypothetical protein